MQYVSYEMWIIHALTMKVAHFYDYPPIIITQ